MGRVIPLYDRASFLPHEEAPLATHAQFNELREFLALALADWEREHGRGLTDEQRLELAALAMGSIARHLANVGDAGAGAGTRDRMVARFHQGFYHHKGSR